MPFARSITNGTIIHYTGPFGGDVPAPPWTAATMPSVMSLIVRPTATFVVERNHSWQDFPKAPRPEDWRPTP